jgi:hypothetical protein
VTAWGLPGNVQGALTIEAGGRESVGSAREPRPIMPPLPPRVTPASEAFVCPAAMRQFERQRALAAGVCLAWPVKLRWWAPRLPS